MGKKPDPPYASVIPRPSPYNLLPPPVPPMLIKGPRPSLFPLIPFGPPRRETAPAPGQSTCMTAAAIAGGAIAAHEVPPAEPEAGLSNLDRESAIALGIILLLIFLAIGYFVRKKVKETDARRRADRDVEGVRCWPGVETRSGEGRTGGPCKSRITGWARSSVACSSPSTTVADHGSGWSDATARTMVECRRGRDSLHVAGGSAHRCVCGCVCSCGCGCGCNVPSQNDQYSSTPRSLPRQHDGDPLPDPQRQSNHYQHPHRKSTGNWKWKTSVSADYPWHRPSASTDLSTGSTTGDAGNSDHSAAGASTPTSTSNPSGPATVPTPCLAAPAASQAFVEQAPADAHIVHADADAGGSHSNGTVDKRWRRKSVQFADEESADRGSRIADRTSWISGDAVSTERSTFGC